MGYIKFTLSIFIFIILCCCSSKSTVHVFSPNKKQCITIITKNHVRYIIDGEHKTIPSKDFVKYSLDSIDLEVADQIVGHWKNSDYEWKVVTDNAIIIENKLDSTKFKFIDNFPIDKDGIPTLINYTDKNSFSIDFDNGTIISYRGLLVEN